MKITKWVDMGQEIEIEIGTDDFRAALSEAFSGVTDPHLETEAPAYAVRQMLNSVAIFLKALTDEQIAASFSDSSKEIVRKFLTEQAERFAVVPSGEVKA